MNSGRLDVSWVRRFQACAWRVLWWPQYWCAPWDSNDTDLKSPYLSFKSGFYYASGSQTWLDIRITWKIYKGPMLAPHPQSLCFTWSQGRPMPQYFTKAPQLILRHSQCLQSLSWGAQVSLVLWFRMTLTLVTLGLLCSGMAALVILYQNSSFPDEYL